jgi:hypothetical protein
MPGRRPYYGRTSLRDRMQGASYGGKLAGWAQVGTPGVEHVISLGLEDSWFTLCREAKRPEHGKLSQVTDIPCQVCLNRLAKIEERTLQHRRQKAAFANRQGAANAG